jgi:cellulose synthase/poly-beta-1,6-N-acetylglucosamine synthase-like glycosyltransferase
LLLLWLPAFGFTAISAVVIIYALYFFIVLKNRKSISELERKYLELQKSNSNIKDVSVIISTYNEANVIARKLKNISELDYPIEQLEILVIDDNSTDGTAEIAERELREKNFNGRIIRNSSRIGLNRSLNLAMAEAKNNLVCITDSDVLLDDSSLRNAVTVLTEFEGVGGVTGKIQPVFDGNGLAQTMESSYRGFYHKSMLAESSIHSAFPGNGPLLVFDKSKVSPSIPVDYGSTDGNIAINIIKSGLRYVYVPNVVVFEPVPETLAQQRLQKVRRAKRLVQVFLHNADIFMNRKYSDFGSIVFPLKFLMITLCPFLMLLGLSFILAYILLAHSVLLYSFSIIALTSFLAGALFSRRTGSILSSFVFHQIYLVAGLATSFRKSVFWKTIQRK